MGVGAKPEGGIRDYLNILSGTGQNIVGLLIAAAATFGAQVLVGRVLGAEGLGVVTVITQAAFVLSFLTRSGMDMAVLRGVAMDVGTGRENVIRAHVARPAVIALAVSLVVAAVVFVAAEPIRRLFSIDPEVGRNAVRAGAAGLPFLALANVWLSATRGLKIMRYTLYVFWAGQPVMWIVFMLIGWRADESAFVGVFAYSLSWAWAAALAYHFWRRESARWPADALPAGEMARVGRYAAPRAFAALFAQLLFWTDLFVVTRFVSDGDVGVYSAALRAAQIVVLFLTSLNLMFSPYVADLHNRGETARLDHLFKTLTRWTAAATLPLFALLAVAPGDVLSIFGTEFADGRTALLILLAGQFVNVMTGSAGFVLIMVGRTGWDLAVYSASFALDLIVVFALAPTLGIRGAAIANALTFAASNGARLALVRRFVGIQPYDRHYVRLIVPAVAALAAMAVVHAAVAAGFLVDLALTGLIGGAVYAGAYALAGLTPGERRQADALLGRMRAR